MIGRSLFRTTDQQIKPKRLSCGPWQQIRTFTIFLRKRQEREMPSALRGSSMMPIFFVLWTQTFQRIFGICEPSSMKSQAERTLPAGRVIWHNQRHTDRECVNSSQESTTS